MFEPFPRLENWSVVAKGDEYTAPEALRNVLQGDVYEHPKYSNGQLIETSSIKEIDAEAGWAETRTRRYLLGKIAPEFQEYLDTNGYKLSDYVTRGKDA